MEMYDLFVQEAKTQIKTLEWRVFCNEADLEVYERRGNMVLANLARKYIESGKSKVTMLQEYIAFMAKSKEAAAHKETVQYNPFMSEEDILLAGGTPWLSNQLNKIEEASQCNILA